MTRVGGGGGGGSLLALNPLSPNSDENEISLYIITTYSNIRVMRIQKVFTNDKMS